MLGLHASHDERTEVVEFKEDGVVKIQDEPVVSPFDGYLYNANDSLINDVKGFLSRPVEIANFTWPVTSEVGVDLINPAINTPGFQLPQLWIQRPMINQKLSGFRFLRCTFRVRIQVNAQPFNAGRLLVWFNPLAGNFSANLNQATSTKHFGGITGYRHVDLDLSESTAVELLIPYIGTLSHVDLITGSGMIGNVRLTVYSKLTGTGTTDIDGTVWVSAEDIHIEVPTGLPLHIVPADRYYNTGKVLREREGKAVVAQINSERKAAAKGTVQTISEATSSVARRLGDVPFIGSIAKSVEWASDAVSGIASIFGWSKPADPAFATVVQQQYARHMNNYNGDAKTKSLAFDAKNEVSIPTMSYCSEEDEMSLAHLIHKSTFADRFFMDTLQPQNSIIWRWPVVPSACTKAISLAPNQKLIFYHTMLSYLSNLFQFWRGGICYHFKIVKTAFHSGRVRVIFVPGATISTDVTTIDVDKCYSKIYDLRDTTGFDFEIPFISNQVWMSMGASWDPSAPSSLSPDAPTGMIYVEVLNTLRNPSTVANNIEFLVETSGGDDLQFAFPQMKVVQPIRFRVPALSDERAKTNIENTVNEGEKKAVEDFPYRIVNAQMCEKFFENTLPADYEPNKLGIGEAVTSLRQLLKKYNFLGVLPAATTNNFNTIWAYGTSSSNSFNTEDVNLFRGYYDYISMLFRLQSGSMRLMLTSQDGTLSPATKIQGRTHTQSNYIAPSTTFYGVEPIATWEPESSGGPVLRFFVFNEQVIEVEVPFYEEFPVNLTPAGGPRFATNTNGDRLNPCNTGTIVAVNNTASLEVFRQVGEDFSFGYSLGPPMGMAALS